MEKLRLESRTNFNKRVCARTLQIRIDSGYTREEMAEALGATYFAMQKYESRTPMPHYFLAKFCLLTGFDPWYVLTGRPEFRSEKA